MGAAIRLATQTRALRGCETVPRRTSSPTRDEPMGRCTARSDLQELPCTRSFELAPRSLTSAVSVSIDGPGGPCANRCRQRTDVELRLSELLDESARSVVRSSRVARGLGSGHARGPRLVGLPLTTRGSRCCTRVARITRARCGQDPGIGVRTDDRMTSSCERGPRQGWQARGRKMGLRRLRF